VEDGLRAVEGKRMTTIVDFISPSRSRPKEKLADPKPTVAVVESEVLLSSIGIEGWEFVDISDEIRLYFRLKDDKEQGFDFKCVEFTASSGNFKSHWDDPELRVQIVVDGIACFDGLRHLYWGHPTEPGYLYYPDAKSLVLIAAGLSELEKRYCWAADQNGGV
jgi:hypothetical protein